MRRSIPHVLSAVAGVLLAGALILPVGAQEATDHITVSPSAARPGDTVTVSGHLECPDSAPGGHVLGNVEYIGDDLWVRAGWDGGGETAASYPQLNADRTFSVGWTIPTTMHEYGVGGQPVPTPDGTFDIYVFCGEGLGPGTQARGTFTVLPAEEPTTTTTEAPTTTTEATTTTEVTTTTTARSGWTPPASPPSVAEPFENRPVRAVPAGTDLEIDEDGFVPGEDVRVVLHSSPRLLTTLVADGTGRVRGTVTIPADTEPGEHVLVLYGTELTRAMALDVTAAATSNGDDPSTPAAPAPGGGSPSVTAPPATPTDLPRTGSGTTVLAILGTALTCAGAGLLRIRRHLALTRP